VAGQWFSPGIPLSFRNKTDRHNITEILLKVVLNTITLALTPFKFYDAYYIFLIVQSFLHVLNILYNTLDWIGKFSCILQPGHNEPRLIALWGQSLFFLTIYFVYINAQFIRYYLKIC
jgi:hypothetical protein